jgi:two-component system alkaline phosphatase synthesis response regulator PhoP
VYALTSAGFKASGFADGAAFFAGLGGALPSLLLLDIMLPGDDGIDILRRIRAGARTRSLPVIMLTAKNSEFDRIRGLDMGADDYVTKPFSVMEVISRVKAVLRRSADAGGAAGAGGAGGAGAGAGTGGAAGSAAGLAAGSGPAAGAGYAAGAGSAAGSGAGSDPAALAPEAPLSVGNIVLRRDRRSVRADGAEITLTYKEFELLHYLMANEGIVVSRDQLLSKIWGFDYSGETRTVDMHIKSLRQKLGAAGALIKTVRNVGYKIGG